MKTARRLTSLLLMLSCCFSAMGQQQILTPEEQIRRDKAYDRYCQSLSEDPRENLQLADSQKAELLELTVNDSTRRAVVISPKENSKPAPVVFVYHGRGGLITKSLKNIAIYKYWPEAIVVYPQGLWKDGGNKIKWGAAWLMPNKKRVGRDIKLFDAQLEYLCKNYNVDTSRIFAMGHSNGGGMTYGLWSVRGEKLAGVCISCCSASAESWLSQMRAPKPVYFLLAEDDQLVDFDKYDAYIKYVIGRQANTGIPVKTAYYPGKHRFNPDELPAIVEFFKAQ